MVQSEGDARALGRFIYQKRLMAFLRLRRRLREDAQVGWAGWGAAYRAWRASWCVHRTNKRAQRGFGSGSMLHQRQIASRW